VLVDHDNNQRQVIKNTYKSLFGKVRAWTVTLTVMLYNGIFMDGLLLVIGLERNRSLRDENYFFADPNKTLFNNLYRFLVI